MDPVASDRIAIADLTTAWLAAERAHDVERLLELVTDDAVFLMPNAQSVSGKAAIGAMFRTYFAAFAGDHRASTEEVQIVGDWAFAWGREANTLTPLGAGAPVELRGFGMSVLHRGPDGRWRFARGINNLALQLPGGAAQSTPRQGSA